MLTFAYCTDGPDAEQLRSSEFASHGRHIASVASRMTFGAPLARGDVDSVAGEATIAASLLCYETESHAEGVKCVLDDPYFRSGAWARVEFYGCRGLQRAAAGDGSAQRRHYFALRRGQCDAELEADLRGVSRRLAEESWLSGPLQWEGFACHQGCTVYPLQAMCAFTATSIDAARARFAGALGRPLESDGWEIFRIPRLSGSWTGLSPLTVIDDHLKATR